MLLLVTIDWMVMWFIVDRIYSSYIYYDKHPLCIIKLDVTGVK